MANKVKRFSDSFIMMVEYVFQKLAGFNITFKKQKRI